jgi:hypothetical protein
MRNNLGDSGGKKDVSLPTDEQGNVRTRGRWETILRGSPWRQQEGYMEDFKGRPAQQFNNEETARAG